MKSLTLEKIGPIAKADLLFGDLTVFVGPQASGKSIALQFLKLLTDKGRVLQQLKQYGIDWGGNLDAFLDAYFGEGMHSIWSAESRMFSDGVPVQMEKLIRPSRYKDKELAFLVPAQRVLALRNGWPRPFADYAPGDPFAVRDFSEKLRGLVEQDFAGGKAKLFPQKGRLKSELRDLLASHVFGSFGLQVNKLASQKRLVLSQSDNAEPLPYMVWSAGQREFVPLLLGLYWLMPPTKVSRREAIEWVMLEEIEMGLHPRAINVVILMVLELLARGYKVCISTHSPQILEAVWAIDRIRNSKASGEELLKVFAAPKSVGMRDLASKALTKSYKVYYFDRDSGKVEDISSLSPDSERIFEANWGGLAEFSTLANTQVAKVATLFGESE